MASTNDGELKFLERFRKQQAIKLGEWVEFKRGVSKFGDPNAARVHAQALNHLNKRTYYVVLVHNDFPPYWVVDPVQLQRMKEWGYEPLETVG